MDSPLYYDGFQMLLRLCEPDSDVESLVFTVAGKLSLAGMNNYGVGICCNTVLQLDFNPHGLPEGFIVRKVLQQRNLDEVLKFMHAIPHASGQNYVIGDPNRVTPTVTKPRYFKEGGCKSLERNYVGACDTETHRIYLDRETYTTVYAPDQVFTAAETCVYLQGQWYPFE